MAMTVLVLQTLPRQRRPTGGTADKEPLRPHVRRRPNQITYPLEPEHRIEQKEGNRVESVDRIRRAGRDERAH